MNSPETPTVHKSEDEEPTPGEIADGGGDMTTVREFASVSTLLVLFVFVFTFDVVCAIALVEKRPLEV